MKRPLLLSLGLHVGALVSLLSSAPARRSEVVELAIVGAFSPASAPPSRGPAVAQKKTPARRHARSTGVSRRPASPAPTARLEPTIGELATAGLALRRRTGAHWSLSLRLDRLRGSPGRAEVEALVERMPVLGAIALAGGREVLDLFDSVQISSISVGSHGSTVWVARHRFEEGELIQALTLAARNTGLPIVEGRLGDLRCFNWPGNGTGEVVVLADPETIVLVDSAVRDALRASGAGWRSLLPPVDRDDLPWPDDVVALFSTAWGTAEAVRPTFGRTPDRIGRVRASPSTLTAFLRIDAQARLDVVAEFMDDDSARDWESRLRQPGESVHRAPGWPTAFLPLKESASAEREGRLVHVHEGLTIDELAAAFSSRTPPTPLADRQTAGPSAPPPQ